VRPFLSFDEWEAQQAESHCKDPLWRMTAYRLSVYALEMAWADARTLDHCRITRKVASQLYAALGSIVGNLGEGYSRSSGPDRAHMFEYALGSARESRAWYLAGRPVLGAGVVAHRTKALDSICALLLTTIPRERKRRVRPNEQPKPGAE
jgi:four helix bundle protein